MLISTSHAARPKIGALPLSYVAGASDPMPANTSARLDAPIVYLVDDEVAVRSGIAFLLRSRHLPSEGCSSGREFEAMIDRHSDAGQIWPSAPTCLLLDLRIPDESGLGLFDRLAERDLTTVMPVIFLAGQSDVRTAVTALKGGAFDFVEKPFTSNSLVDRVERALQESARQIAVRAERCAMRLQLSQLSRRERETVELVLRGHVANDIAERLGVGESAIEEYWASAFGKMSVTTALELLAELRRLSFDI